MLDFMPDAGLREALLSSEESDCGPVVAGTLLAMPAEGGFSVLLPGGQEGVAALSAISLTAADIGRTVMVAFGVRPGAMPVITGRRDTAGASRLRARLEGERLVLEAGREIELRCGDASIVLTKAGKVLIKGNFVLTHARGINRIRGAGVQIN